MRNLLVLSVVLLLSTTCFGASIIEQEPEIKVKVVNVFAGDVIAVHDGSKDPAHIIHLYGIKVPKKGEKNYEEAKTYLKDMLLNKQVIMKKWKDNTSYATIFTLDGKNINEDIIKAGLARKVRYKKTRYASGSSSHASGHRGSSSVTTRGDEFDKMCKEVANKIRSGQYKLARSVENAVNLLSVCYGNGQPVTSPRETNQRQMPPPPVYTPNQVPPPPVYTPNQGAINVRTGEFYPPVAGGVINPKTGTFYPDVGGGYINPKTGEFMPKIGGN